MTKITTPAEAYDAAQDKMVRIPEQFPDYVPSVSPFFVASAIDSSAGLRNYVAPTGHFLSFSNSLADQTELSLTIDNFNPVNGLCVLKASSSSASASLFVSLADQPDITVSAMIPLYNSLQMVIALSVDNTGKQQLILLSSSVDDIDS